MQVTNDFQVQQWGSSKENSVQHIKCKELQKTVHHLSGVKVVLHNQQSHQVATPPTHSLSLSFIHLTARTIKIS